MLMLVRGQRRKTYVRNEARMRRRWSNRRIIFISIAAVLVIAAGLFAFSEFHPLDKTEPEERIPLDQSTVRFDKLVYNGVTYVENPNVTTLLLLGIDRDVADNGKVSTNAGDFRNGGQADFIMLVVIDDTHKTIRRLQIDRDTMTEVPYYSVLGKPLGTRKWQIALAHSMGSDKQENNQNTITALQNLFNGALDTEMESGALVALIYDGALDVDMCAALYLEGIAKFNDALDGVEVLIEDDFASADMPVGETVPLNGAQAETFVRARSRIGGGTNVERMRRQQVYMSAALDKILSQSKQDSAFLGRLLDMLEGDHLLVCDFKSARLINEVNKAINYEIRPIEYLNGTSTLVSVPVYEPVEGGEPEQVTLVESEENEFYPDEVYLTEWVLDAFYIVQS